ncbi:LysR family transcriptional regulator [Burkholderia cenocepacia]|uniref:LysR family transcriptional regulator n=1 Tax=Burkholderia cenocepacia TaxID=95486 RepID=A0A3S9NEA8_9BURK|nr:LysR family transcriptional regulator [Burkholderia cenocepacia]AZQ53931.1 LysR family transcriptional regulator [Burkholderia cenocepacia]
MLNRLDLLKIFSAAAAAPTFREAAARLGVSPQVVTRAVRELEDRLGETLFHRTTRSIRITAFGQTFARDAQGALAAVDGLFGPAAGQRDEAVGVVRITAPSGMGRHYVQPILAGLMQRYPGLVPDLRLSDVPSPVVDEQIDIGVRVGAIGDNRFVARMVGPLPMWVVAAPSLIRRLGEPKNRKALEAMPVTCLIDRASGRPWPWTFRGEHQFVPSSPAYLTDDAEVEVDAVCAGVGLGQCSEYLVRAYVEKGRLVRVLPSLEPEPWKLHVYRPRRGPMPRRIRVVYDELVAKLAEATWRE